MKVHELKTMLEDFIENLDRYDDDAEVRMSCNTYGLYAPFLATRNGFIEMNDPVSDEEDW